ncbi:MAG: hypothetical protein KJ621_07300 [Proteobacteria bacterium]|nr:hypothetical protein [Pseudomonadota bacterium]
MASRSRRYTFRLMPVVGAVCFLAAAAGPAGADEGRFSLSGFDRVRFGTRLDRVKKLYPLARPAPDAAPGEVVWRLPGSVQVAGVRFAVKLGFTASRLSEVTYLPQQKCRRGCLRAIRLDLEARLGQAPEVLDDEAAVKTWLWVSEVGGGQGDGGTPKRWISVMVNFEPSRLIEISVSDQTDQQIMKARRPITPRGPCPWG